MTAIDKGRPEDRAVSEALGFLLIFTMVIVGIGLVTLYGYPMLIQQQTSADEKIMEKNMIVLQNDLKSITYKSVPYKETALKIGGGSMTVYNQSRSSAGIIVYDTDAIYYAGSAASHVNPVGELVYVSDSADTNLSLQNGAVVKQQHLESGSVMLSEPRWFYDDYTKTLVINLIGINSTSTMSRAGIGIVQMQLGQTGYMNYNLPPGKRICVKYTDSNYATAWNTYFVNTMGMVSDSSGTETGGYCLTSSPNTLVVKTFEVIIRSV
jgi:hypothetical protein